MTEELTKELEEEVRALLHRHIYGDILELARNLERKLMGSMPYYMDENLRKQVDELIDGLKYHGKKNHETNTTST